jgi:hypothetical protein
METDKSETNQISQAKSIIILPFDLNISNPEISDPYTRIISKKSPGKRNKLSDIINDPDEKVSKFIEAIKKDKFEYADSIIDTSKYFDFIANNFNYKKNKEDNKGYLNWYQKTVNRQKYILQKNELDTKDEFIIEKFEIILNEKARSGSILIEIMWTGVENKLELLSGIDFFRYHDNRKNNNTTRINELIKKEFSNGLTNLEEITPFIKLFKAKENKDKFVEIAGEVQIDETKITDCGFCISKNNPPSISDKIEKIDRYGKNIKVPLKNLEENTTYYYCAYCIDKSQNVNYGNVHSFTTASSREEINPTSTSIAEIVKNNYLEIYNLIFFNHVKPTVVHLIKESEVIEKDDETVSKLIYKALRIPNKSEYPSVLKEQINYSEIVKLQSPDQSICFATMNEGAIIIDNTIEELSELGNIYLPAFVLALNQREFLLKVIRLVTSVDTSKIEELKDLKKFITEIYLKQISFTVSVYNEIDIFFTELQKKFDIEILMNDNKESINEIHQLIEELDNERKAAEEKEKATKLNFLIIGLTVIQVISIFYTLLVDFLENDTILTNIFLFLNTVLIIFLLIYYYFKNKSQDTK